MRWLAVVLSLLLCACLGGEPRRPTRPRSAERPPAEEEPLYLGSGGEGPRDDRFSIDAMLPRSGDPARPNVKVELSVLDVRSSRNLGFRAGVRGSLVRGTVNLRAALSAGSRSGRHRTRNSSFIVVQTGREGLIQLTQENQFLIGRYQALQVFVISAGRDGVELALGPYVSPTSRRGEHLSGMTQVFVRPGEALVIGGMSSAADHETRSWGSYSERSSSRELMALLSVDVLG